MFNHVIVKQVKALPNFLLACEFQTGEKRLYDVKPWIKENKAFSPLKSVKGLFKNVHVDCAGYGVSWNDDIDLDAQELFENGTKITKTFQITE